MPPFDKKRAEAEALQEPALDPIMLLASLASGGLSALPEGLENQTIKRAALSKLAGEPDEFIRKFMTRLAEQTPSLLKTIGKGVGGAAGRFTGANAASNIIAPGHPQAANLYALANAPAFNVAKLPNLLRYVKGLEKGYQRNVPFPPYIEGLIYKHLDPLIQQSPLYALMSLALKGDQPRKVKP